MTSPTTDRRLGLVGNTAMKAPVTVLADSNITLSGEQTIDGISVLASNASGVPDRVLCVGQTDATQNGIWDVSTSAWTRSLDANGNYDFTAGTTVLVTQGNTYAGSYWKISTTGSITIGTTSLSWSRALASALSTLSFLQAGTGAVLRGAQDKMRDVLCVFDFMSQAQVADVQAFTYGQDVTSVLASAMTAAAGKTLYFPEGGYLTGRLFPASNTTIVLDGGVTIRKKVNGTQVFRLTDVDNVHIFCNGATLDGGTSSDASPSHTVYFESSKKCSLRDANVLGAGAAKDCIYIGEGGTRLTPSEDTYIAGGSCVNAKRNGISVVSSKRALIERVEIYGTTGSPGAGIDVEANAYDDVEQTTIRKCRLHDNQTYGVVITFGDRTKVEDCDIYDNTVDGIGCAASGVQFTAGVYRSNVDVRGVSAFDSANGRVSVGGDIAKLPVGTLVSFTTQNGAAIPVTFQAATQWVIAAHVAGSSTDVILGLGVDYQVKNTLSDAGSGTMNADPTLSDVKMRCFVEGQCSNIEIIGNRVHSNGGDEVRLAQAVGVRLHDNTLDYDGTAFAMRLSYIRDLHIVGNRLTRVSGTSTGMSVGTCTGVRSERNVVEGFVTRGITSSSCSYSVWRDDMVINCGSTAGDSLRITECTGPRVVGVVCRNDEDTTNTNGIIYTTVTSGRVERAICRGAGTTNATSINVGTAKVIDSIVYDGTYYGEGSATWDPGNLVDGAGETSSAVAVTGATFGDRVLVSFDKNLSGLILTGYVSSSGNCTARLQNESGGAVDLPSGTVKFNLVR